GTSSLRARALRHNSVPWHVSDTGRSAEAASTLHEALSWLDPQRDSAVVTAGRHTGGTLALLCADVDGAAARYGEAPNDTKPGDKAFRYLLAGVALVADRRDQPERALRLLGAAAKASHDKSVAERWWHELLADAEERGRDGLGARRAVAAVAAGAALTAVQACECALSDSWPG